MEVLLHLLAYAILSVFHLLGQTRQDHATAAGASLVGDLELVTASGEVAAFLQAFNPCQRLSEGSQRKN
jgi:hypothetical protein